MPIIKGPAGMDPILGKMRTKDVSGGTASGDYTFNTAEFTVGVAGLVSLNQVPASKLDTVLDIVNVTGASVTLQPNTAYKIYATSQAITLNANTPAAGKWAYEGHLEIFTAGTGYVVTGTNVVLSNALEPDAVNNCTVRFHDGIAIISVEDHVAGYIVVNGSTSGDGSLAYGIATSTNDYVAFDASLNGTTIPLAGAVAEGEKHVVGNGYTSTTLTGAVNCGTSKFTVANLGLNNIQITGGIMTFGDAHIPSGSTVAVSGGGLAIEKVTGAGSESVIDLGGTSVSVLTGRTASASGVNFASGTLYQDGGGLTLENCEVSNNAGRGVFSNPPSSAPTIIKSCVISGCSGGVFNYGGHVVISASTVTANMSTYGGGIYVCKSASIINSLISGNMATSYDNSADLFVSSGATAEITGSTIGNACPAGGAIMLYGNNTIDKIGAYFAEPYGTVTISSGAILDLTGNTNATPIAPGGGIVFSGANQIIYGTTESPTTAYIDGCTVATIASGGVVQLSTISDGVVTVPRRIEVRVGDWSAENCTISGGNGGNGGNMAVTGGTASFVSCTITGGTGSYTGGAANIANGGSAVFADCTFIDNNAAQIANKAVRFDSGATGILSNCVFSANQTNQVVSGGTVIVSGTLTLSSGANVYIAGEMQIKAGAVVTLVTASIQTQTNGTINVTGGITVNGNPVSSGTYTKINEDGTTEPPQA